MLGAARTAWDSRMWSGSTYGRPMTLTPWSGTATVSTTTYQFAPSSARITGSGPAPGTGISVTPVDVFDFGAGDCTIEFWVRLDDAGVSPAQRALLGTLTSSGSSQTNLPRLQYTSNDLYYIISDGTPGSPKITATNAFPSSNTWYAVALVKSSNTITLYVDGVNVGSYAGYGWDTFSTCVFGGQASSGGSITSLEGYMDEIRISNIARYSGNYTPSTSEFTNDSNTLLLCHCTGSNGWTVFSDDDS